jgi:hypothetical protein
VRQVAKRTLEAIAFAALAIPSVPLCAQHPKVLIIYDMEGISGVVTPSYERFGAPEYPQGRESLTADVRRSTITAISEA